MPATPDAEQAVRLAKATVDLYAQAAERLLATVARRLARGIDRPGWAERKLLEVTALRDEAQAVLDRLLADGPEAVRTAVAEAYRIGALDAARDLSEADLTATFGRTNRAAVAALVDETVTAVQSTHLQILRSTLDTYRAVVAEAGAPAVVAGTQTRRQVAQAVLDRFANRGVTGFVDNRGRRWELESYTEMAVRTSAGRAQVQGTLDRFTDAGRDLVIVSDAPQECRVCRPFELRILSISGASVGERLPDGQVVFDSIAGARAAGLWHANCRHSAGLYVPGLTRRPDRPTADPEGDRARQEQRRLERGVRQWKRRQAVALDDQARARAEVHARQWQGRLREHVAANDLKRQRQRERLGPR